MAEEDAVGIDFGTSYCKMVRYEDGQLRAVRIGGPQGQVLVPSVVQFPLEHGEGPEAELNTVVGEEARASRISRRDRTWPSAAQGHGPIKLHLSDPEFGLVFNGRRYWAQQMAEDLLVFLCEGAAASLGQAPTHAVITVPAYFRRDQVHAIMQAARDVPLPVIRHVAEPVAAAIAYSFWEGLRGSVLAYDFGGGTVDIALLEVDERRFRILTRAGQPDFGGMRLDRLLYERFLQPQAREMTGFRLDLDRPPPQEDKHGSCDLNKQRLLDFAERARIALSSTEAHETTLRLQLPCEAPDCDPSDGHQVDEIECRFTLSRSELEGLLGDEINATFGEVHRAVRLAGFRGMQDLDHVLLVGGVTRMPLIRDRMRELAGDKLRVPRDPDLLVAEGAALVAAHPAYRHAVIEDVLARSLRRRLPDKPETVVVIERGTALDKARTAIRGPWPGPHVQEATILLYEGEEEEYSRNDGLGVVRVRKLAGDLPAGSQIAVTLEYDVETDGWAVSAETPEDARLEATLERDTSRSGLAPDLEAVRSNEARLVLCIDVSRSFRRAHLAAVEPECLRLERQVREAGTKCHLGLVAFSDERVAGEGIAEFGLLEDEDALQGRLGDLPSHFGGDTAEDVGPALLAAAGMLRREGRDESPRVVCVFTDTGPRGTEEIDRACAALQSVRARTFIFAPKSPYEEQYGWLARETDGGYIDLHRGLYGGIDRVVRAVTQPSDQAG